MKKFLVLLALCPSMVFAKCDNVDGDWLGRSLVSGNQKTYAISINEQFKDIISVTELEPERATRTINSSYRLVDCQMEFLLHNTDNGHASVIMNFTNNKGYGFLDDNKGRHFLEFTR